MRTPHPPNVMALMDQVEAELGAELDVFVATAKGLLAERDRSQASADLTAFLVQRHGGEASLLAAWVAIACVRLAEGGES